MIQACRFCLRYFQIAVHHAIALSWERFAIVRHGAVSAKIRIAPIAVIAIIGAIFVKSRFAPTLIAANAVRTIRKIAPGFVMPASLLSLALV